MPFKTSQRSCQIMSTRELAEFTQLSINLERLPEDFPVPIPTSRAFQGQKNSEDALEPKPATSWSWPITPK